MGWLNADIELAASKSEIKKIRSRPFRPDPRVGLFWSLDMESALRISCPPSIHDSNKFLFLDQNLTDGHDIVLNKNRKSRVNPGLYYELINIFFDQVSANGQSTIVVPHPKASRSIQSTRYNAKITNEEASRAVMGSRLVFAHDTTAISFAVIFRKPIVFLSSRTFSVDLQLRIQSLADFLNRPLINIEDQVDKDSIDSWCEVDEKFYSKYEFEFLSSKGRGIPKKPLWEEISVYLGNTCSKA
jgi:hypothetical protein